MSRRARSGTKADDDSDSDFERFMNELDSDDEDKKRNRNKFTSSTMPTTSARNSLANSGASGIFTSFRTPSYLTRNLTISASTLRGSTNNNINRSGGVGGFHVKDSNDSTNTEDSTSSLEDIDSYLNSFKKSHESALEIAKRQVEERRKSLALSSVSISAALPAKQAQIADISEDDSDDDFNLSHNNSSSNNIPSASNNNDDAKSLSSTTSSDHYSDDFEEPDASINNTNNISTTKGNDFEDGVRKDEESYASPPDSPVLAPGKTVSFRNPSISPTTTTTENVVESSVSEPEKKASPPKSLLGAFKTLDNFSEKDSFSMRLSSEDEISINEPSVLMAQPLAREDHVRTLEGDKKPPLPPNQTSSSSRTKAPPPLDDQRLKALLEESDDDEEDKKRFFEKMESSGPIDYALLNQKLVSSVSSIATSIEGSASLTASLTNSIRNDRNNIFSTIPSDNVPNDHDHDHDQHPPSPTKQHDQDSSYINNRPTTTSGVLHSSDVSYMNNLLKKLSDVSDTADPLASSETNNNDKIDNDKNESAVTITKVPTPKPGSHEASPRDNRVPTPSSPVETNESPLRPAAVAKSLSDINMFVSEDQVPNGTLSKALQPEDSKMEHTSTTNTNTTNKGSNTLATFSVTTPSQSYITLDQLLDQDESSQEGDERTEKTSDFNDHEKEETDKEAAQTSQQQQQEQGQPMEAPATVQSKPESKRSQPPQSQQQPQSQQAKPKQSKKPVTPVSTTIKSTGSFRGSSDTKNKQEPQQTASTSKPKRVQTSDSKHVAATTTTGTKKTITAAPKKGDQQQQQQQQQKQQQERGQPMYPQQSQPVFVPYMAPTAQQFAFPGNSPSLTHATSVLLNNTNSSQFNHSAIMNLLNGVSQEQSGVAPHLTLPPPLMLQPPPLPAQNNNFYHSSILELVDKEVKLHQEIDRLQRELFESRKANEQLEQQIEHMKQQFATRENEIKFEYDTKMQELKDLNYDLSVKVKEMQSVDYRKNVRDGAPLSNFIGGEEYNGLTLAKIEDDIRAQEVVIQGYEQENKRLISELKEAQAKLKEVEHRAFFDNRPLQQSQSNVNAAMLSAPTETSALNKARNRAFELEKELHNLREDFTERELELKQQITKLRKEKKDLESKLAGVDLDKIHREESIIQTLEATIREMETKHKSEVADLNSKLQWYVENQQLISQSEQIIEQQRNNINALTARIAELEDQVMAAHSSPQKNGAVKGCAKATSKSNGAITLRSAAGNNSNTAESKKIRELQKQIVELENIIKSKNPNSIPALIRAVRPSEEENLQMQMLQERVAFLTKELEEKDNKSEKILRTLRQEMDKQKAAYEKRIQSIQEELTAAKASQEDQEAQSKKAQHTRAELQKQLDETRNYYIKRIRELEAQVKNGNGNTKNPNSKKKNAATGENNKASGNKISEAKKKLEEMYAQRFEILQRELQKRDEQIKELETQLESLRGNNHSNTNGPRIGDDVAVLQQFHQEQQQQQQSGSQQGDNSAEKIKSLQEKINALQRDNDVLRTRNEMLLQSKTNNWSAAGSLEASSDLHFYKKEVADLKQKLEVSELTRKALLDNAQTLIKQTYSDSAEKIATLRYEHEKHIQQLKKQHQEELDKLRSQQLNHNFDHNQLLSILQQQQQHAQQLQMLQQLAAASSDTRQQPQHAPDKTAQVLQGPPPPPPHPTPSPHDHPVKYNNNDYLDKTQQNHQNHQIQQQPNYQFLIAEQDGNGNGNNRMQQLQYLAQRLNEIEIEHKKREQEMRQLLAQQQQQQQRGGSAVNNQQKSLEQALRAKNSEIERFRAEMDSLLATMMELKRRRDNGSCASSNSHVNNNANNPAPALSPSLQKAVLQQTPPTAKYAWG